MNFLKILKALSQQSVAREVMPVAKQFVKNPISRLMKQKPRNIEPATNFPISLEDLYGNTSVLNDISKLGFTPQADTLSAVSLRQLKNDAKSEEALRNAMAILTGVYDKTANNNLIKGLGYGGISALGLNELGDRYL